MDLSDRSIFVAGANGMVGRAVVRELTRLGHSRLLTPSSAELDLTDQKSVNEFFSASRPDIVVVAAARVGGIVANNEFRADFIYENLMIEANVINAAHRNDTQKLLMLGSSCIYPKNAAQPMREEELLSGFLEFTNEPYAVAKIAGIKLCESYYRQYGRNFLSVMPTNLYGPHDNFDLRSSHVIPALIRKFHEAKKNGAETVEMWGSGMPLREFMYVDDLASAVIFVLENLEAIDVYGLGISHLNVGTGKDVTIKETAELIAEIIGFTGSIVHDTEKPDGTPRKLLDVSRLSELGWSYRTELREGLETTYKWYLDNENEVRKLAAV
jgi:GDP-L-fucose synthase